MGNTARVRGLPRWLALVTALLLVAAACGNDDSDGNGATGDGGTGGGETPQGDPYVIGVNVDLSGNIAFAGIPQEAGFRTYIDFVNDEKGGVDGRPIDVKTLDSRADGSVSLSNYQELVRDEGAIATTGYISSIAWSASGAAADDAGVVQVGSAGVDELVSEFHPFVFKAGQSQRVALDIQFQYLEQVAEEEGIDEPTIGVMTIATASGPVFEEASNDLAAERGWEVVEVQEADVATSDCSAQARSMVSADPTFIVANWTNSGEDLVCFQALEAAGWESPAVNSFYGMVEPTFERLSSPNFFAERVFVWPTDETVDAAQTMMERAETYGHADKVDAFFVDGYVVGMLFEEALIRCGDDCDADGFRDALESIEAFDTGGLSGPNTGFTAGPNGHMMTPEGKIYQWDDEAGQAVAVTDWLCGLPGRC